MSMTYSSLELRCSPIQTLPVELLSYIFALAVHEVDEDGKSPLIDSETIKMPLILSSVCRYWCNVVHQTPSLWSSLCISAALVELGAGQGGQLNTTHLSKYLALSQHQPLDILIDARDEEWDFTEVELVDPAVHGGTNYQPPFTSVHMCTTMSLLLPHMSRWRSLSILTDSWVQMYVALQGMQPFITTNGAPCLESLTLMRCNDFVSHSPRFEPSHMRLPAFLNLSDATASHHNLLPRLRNLTLHGVHVDWSSLSYIVSKGDQSLNSLKLSSHCLDIRPTLREFHQLLAQCPDLKNLVVDGSGPLIPDGSTRTSIINEDIQPVSLPRLRNMTLGYRSVLEGQAILEIIDAPHVDSLIVLDGTHPAVPEDLDASNLLNYLATRNTPEPVQDAYESYVYTTNEGEIVVDKDGFLIATQKPLVVNVSSNKPSRAVFPQLRSLTLRGVKTHESVLHHFLSAHQHLLHLEFDHMSTQSLRALHPQQSLTQVPGAMVCACPQLQRVCFRGRAQMEDLLYLAGEVARDRFTIAGSILHSVDIEFTSESGPDIQEVIQLSNVGTTVKIIGRGLSLHEDDCMDWDTDSDMDSAYEIGGAFNDPIFDIQYSGVISGY